VAVEYKCLIDMPRSHDREAHGVNEAKILIDIADEYLFGGFFNLRRGINAEQARGCPERLEKLDRRSMTTCSANQYVGFGNDQVRGNEQSRLSQQGSVLINRDLMVCISTYRNGDPRT
jgi:hypothetical protein